MFEKILENNDFYNKLSTVRFSHNNIKKIIQDSFVEYEGEQSVVFFTGLCNMKCAYCYNYKELNSIPKFLELTNDYISDESEQNQIVLNSGLTIGDNTDVNNIKQFEKMLEEYITPLTTAVVWLGGEPFCENLSIYLNVVKSIYPNLKQKVFTNGVNTASIIMSMDYVDMYSIDFKIWRTDSYTIINKNFQSQHNNRDSEIVESSYVNSYVTTIVNTIRYLVLNGKKVEVRTVAAEGVNVDKIKECIKLNFKDEVEHIVTKDMRDNYKQIKALK